MKKTPQLFSFFVFLLFVSFSLTSQAGIFGDIKGHKGEHHDAKFFAKAFNEGASSANEITLPLANGGQLKTLAGYKQISVPGAVSAHQFAVNGWVNEAFTDKIMVYPAGGVIANYGNRFEYLVQLPEAPARFVDRIENQLKKAKKNLGKAGKGIVVTYPRTEKGQLSIHAAFTYDSKTSTGKLKKHIEQLLLGTSYLLNDYLVARDRAANDYMKELRKSKPANLEKADFYLMLEDFAQDRVAPFDVENPDAPDGYAEFTNSGRYIRIWNYKTSFAWGVAAYPDKSIPAEKVQWIMDEWQKWGQKKLGKGSTKVEIRKDRYDGGYVLTVVYPLDGTLKGKDIDKYFDHFLQKGLHEAGKTFDKLQQKAM